MDDVQNTPADAAEPGTTVAGYLALNAADRVDQRARFERRLADIEWAYAAMLVTDAADAVREQWPDAATVVFDTCPTNYAEWTSVHTVRDQAGETLWTDTGDDEPDDDLELTVTEVGDMVGEALSRGPSVLEEADRIRRIMRLDAWLRPDRTVTEPPATAPSGGA